MDLHASVELRAPIRAPLRVGVRELWWERPHLGSALGAQYLRSPALVWGFVWRLEVGATRPYWTRRRWAQEVAAVGHGLATRDAMHVCARLHVHVPPRLRRPEGAYRNAEGRANGRANGCAGARVGTTGGRGAARAEALRTQTNDQTLPVGHSTGDAHIEPHDPCVEEGRASVMP